MERSDIYDSIPKKAISIRIRVSKYFSAIGEVNIS